MIIAVYNNKGGVGKTTLSTSIAFRAKEKGISLLFIDADKQMNGIKWLSNDTWNREEELMIGSLRCVTDLNDSAYERANDIVVIDCPPEYEFVDKLQKVDIWLVPVKGRFSLDGASNLITSLRKDNRNNERIVFVSNMLDVQTEIGQKQIKEAQTLGVELYKYAIARSLNFEKAEDMCVPVWDVPYAQRSGAVQALLLFSDWALRGCQSKGTYGDTDNAKILSRVGKYEIE